MKIYICQAMDNNHRVIHLYEQQPCPLIHLFAAVVSVYFKKVVHLNLFKEAQNTNNGQ